MIGRADALSFDGPGFLEAVQNALDLGGPPAELYTELALQAVRRSGMWVRRYDPASLDGWVKQALDLSPEGTPTYPRALAAFALRTTDEDAARKLQAVAEELGDPELRSHAFAALTAVAWRSGDLDRARAAVEQRLEMLDRISDPDDHHFALMQASEVALAQARLADAADIASKLEALVEGLTPHHRLHGVFVRLRVETLACGWDAIRAQTPVAEAAVEANATTPCPANLTTLLFCAVADERAGESDEARRLELLANSVGTEGFDEFDTPRIRLALLRGDMPGVRSLIDGLKPVTLVPHGFDRAAALFDALVALGDGARAEAEAPPWLLPGTYVEPFALRALGVTRGDPELLRQAAGRFEAMGLDYHVAETHRLMP
jgi:hypothetical protein